MTEAVDHEARTDVALTRQLIEGHIETCYRRWDKNEHVQDQIQVSLTTINKKLDQASGAYKTMVAIGSAGALIGSGAAWLLQHLKL